MGKTKTTYLTIDGQLLKEAFNSRNVSIYQAEAALGCGKGLTNAAARNKISKPLAILIASEYGIAFEEIKPKKVEPVPEEAPARETCEFIVTPQISREQWDLLEKIIEVAVLKAAKTIIESLIDEGEDE